MYVYIILFIKQVLCLGVQKRPGLDFDMMVMTAIRDIRMDAREGSRQKHMSSREQDSDFKE